MTTSEAHGWVSVIAFISSSGQGLSVRHTLRVLDHNRWLAGAELDLVVRRGRVLAFVEVKSKSGEGFGDPFEMVPPAKIARIQRAAELWLRLHPELEGLDVRFDVLAERAGKIEHLPDAF